MSTNNSRQDPLALASAEPDIAALVKEFELAQQNGNINVNTIAIAENARYNLWPGKSPARDGLKWQKNARPGEVVRPYDGRPDVDNHLTDEIVSAEVDMLLTALAMAQLNATTTHTTALTAAQMGELLAVANWCRRAVQTDLADDAELLFTMMTMLGWSVLNPGWLERWELVERTVTIDEIIQSAQQAQQMQPGSLAAQLPVIILDATLEDMAVEIAQQEYPHMSKPDARRVVRELRTAGITTFLDRQLAEKRPTVRTLIQGYNYFVSGTAGKLHKARGHLIVERFYEAELRQVAADNGWDEDFVDAAVKTAGQYSSYGEAMRSKDQSEQVDPSERSIEIWTTMVNQFDPDRGAAGIYCTTLSPHVKDLYARHYLLDFAHGRAPFIAARREVNGPSITDSRGVPEMVRSDQQVCKRLTDAFVVRAHLEATPPRALIGAGWTKVKGNVNEPGALIENQMPGASVQDMGPGRGNVDVTEKAIERIESSTARRFALPNTRDGSHPMSWQMRQTRVTKRGLEPFEEMFTQLVVLAYQELGEQELADIIGRWPQLTVDDVLKHRVTLTFDPRGLDNDWRKDTLATMVQLLTMDKGGTMDSNKLISLIGSYTDPTIMQAVTADAAGASAKLYRKVGNDILDIMTGNPPPLVEMDATAGMQLQMAFQIIGQNQKYQQILQQDEGVKENLKTYIQNLQHSVQQTQLSPDQGRLGVAQMPQRPVQQGTPQLTAGN